MHEMFWKIRGGAQHRVRLVSKVFRRVYKLTEFFAGCFIPLAAHFENQPCFPHGVHGIFISGAARIGRNCVIFQHVTIGSNTLAKSKGLGFPTVGDNCYIGAGAKIIGNVKIGDNVRIAANAVVYQDVPSNSVVTSNTQVIRPLTEPDNRFYSFRNEWVYFEDGVWKTAEDQTLFEKLGRPY